MLITDEMQLTQLNLIIDKVYKFIREGYNIHL